MGMNISGINDWSTQMPFIDIMKQSRGWKDWRDQGSKAGFLTDKSGWITELRQNQIAGTVFLTAPEPPIYTTYYVFYDGDGAIEYHWAAQKNTRLSRPDRDVIEVNHGSSLLNITRTNPKNPIRNIRIIAKQHLEHYQQGQRFNPDWIKKIEHLRALRYMDWMGTNNSKPYSWQNRPKLTDRTWATKGIPLEVISELSNLTRTAPWITLPHWADEKFVEAAGNTFKQHLSSALPLYIEHSNEMWNWQFKQAHYALKMGKALWGKEGNAYMQWHGMRTAKICDTIKTQVFKKTPDRVTCVLGVQTSWHGLENAALDCPLWSDAPCYKHSIDALAITTYFSAGLNGPGRKDKKAKARAKELIKLASSAQSLELAHKQITHGGVLKKNYPGVGAELKSQLNYWSKVAKKRGLRLLAYEGGQHISANGYLLQENKKIIGFHREVNRAPFMGSVYRELLNTWKQGGGELHMHFSDIAKPSKFGSWGALEAVTQTGSPKWDAIVEFNRTNPCWWSYCNKYPIERPLK